MVVACEEKYPLAGQAAFEIAAELLQMPGGSIMLDFDELNP